MAYSQYERYRDQVVSVVDQVMAETIRHLPLLNGERDDRPVSEFQGIVRTGESDLHKLLGSTRKAAIMASGGQLYIKRETAASLQIRQGDKIVCLSRVSEPVFEVSDVDERDHARIICQLGDMN